MGGAAVSGGTLELDRRLGFTGQLPLVYPWEIPQGSESKNEKII